MARGWRTAQGASRVALQEKRARLDQETAPTQSGVEVGCSLPPAGSSVMASAFTSGMASSGLATSLASLPSRSGQNVIEGIGFALESLGISQSCKTRFPESFGTS